ncbi:hypothetical protein [Cytophaga sp. FL35]|uniref:hypothetical protein n=1 Tax=Cytophaga sp. FL35 TaxID=1904456 RepID=UPI0016534DF2|nr:hypothetical protein [Cytophaga sp. FL35]MBC7000306.1 hypothetical protein [Cytophaga sp. FL35]
MKSDNIISPELQKTLAKLSDVLKRFKREYPDEMDMIFKDHDQLFAEYGWYIYNGCTVEQVLIILKLFNQSESELAQETIKEIFHENLDEIESDLTRIISESSHIIKEAFICHNRQLYYASTILFLSLADGLANGKLFTKSYFDKIKKKNNTHFLLDIFTDKNPVNQKFNPKSSPKSELMRHGIMHGISNQYGNETNSLKALSLLHYISIRRYKLLK